MLRIALKSIFARKWRLVLTAMSIVLGITFVSGTFALSDTLTRSVNALINDLFVGIDTVVRSSDGQENPFGGDVVRPAIDESVLDQVNAVAGVREAVGQVQAFPTLLGPDGKRLGGGFGPPTLMFNWTDDPELSGGGLSSGRPPVGPDEVVLDGKTAEANDWGIGDEITAQFPEGSQEFTIVGLGGIGEDGDKSLGGRVLLVSTPTAQQLAGLDGQFNSIAVAAEDGVSQQELTDDISAVLGDGLEAITGKTFIDETQEQVGQIIGFITQLVQIFGWVALFVAAFIIYNTFSIVVAQRMRELALLRAVGASRNQIRLSVLVEALMVGLVAAVIGLFAGWLLALGLAAALRQVITLANTVPRITMSSVIVSLLIGSVVTVLSALIPAFRATKIPPVAALGESSLESSHIGISRKVFGSLAVVGGIAALFVGLTQDVANALSLVGIGVALVFVSIIVIGPAFAAPAVRFLGYPLPAMAGMTGTLARENASRNPKRTASTAAALTVGVSLVALIAIMASSFKSAFADQVQGQLSADLIIDNGGFGPNGLPTATRATVEANPDVAAVASIRYGAATILNSKAADDERAKAAANPPDTPAPGPVGEVGFLRGVDATSYLQLVDSGDLIPEISEIKTDEVVIAATRAKNNGWSPGDTITIWTPDGGELDMTIAATVSEQFGGDDSYMVNLDTYDKMVNPVFGLDTLMLVEVADGADVEAVTASLTESLTTIAPAAAVQNLAAYVEEQTEQLNGLVNVIYALLFLAVIIAIFGVGNTLSLSILERRREIGLTRAVGARGRQVSRSVLLESLIISLFGTLLGLALGIVFSYALIAAFDGQGISVHLPIGQLVVFAIAGGLAGVLAAFLPSRRAARTDILGAIASA